MEFQLSPEQQHQLAELGVIEDGKVVLMSINAYQALLGIGTDQEFADSSQKCNDGIDQIESGSGVSIGDFFASFYRRHGIQD